MEEIDKLRAKGVAIDQKKLVELFTKNPGADDLLEEVKQMKGAFGELQKKIAEGLKVNIVDLKNFLDYIKVYVLGSQGT